MGISVSRAYKLQEFFVSQVVDIISRSKSFHLKHENLVELLGEKIYNTQEYKSVPEWVRSYISGYTRARMDELYRYELEWRMWVKFSAIREEFIQQIHMSTGETNKNINLTNCGNLFTSRQIRELSRYPQFVGVWNMIDGNKSCHVWKSYPNSPF